MQVGANLSEKYTELSVRDNIGIGGAINQQEGDFDLASIRTAAKGSGTDDLVRSFTSFYETQLTINFHGNMPPSPVSMPLMNIYGEVEGQEMPYVLKALGGNVFQTTKHNGKTVYWGGDRPKTDIYHCEIPDLPYQHLVTPEPVHRVGLSGGQWQRIALARAFMRIKEADLLILDEPSSALDPQAEYQVFKTILELRKNKTTLFIVILLSTSA